MTAGILRTGPAPRPVWALTSVLAPLGAWLLWLADPALAQRLSASGWSALALLWSVFVVAGALRRPAATPDGPRAPTPAATSESGQPPAACELPQTRWLRGATHELRNRLAALDGAAEVLHMVHADAAVQARARTIVAEQVLALGRLADHLDGLLADGLQRPAQVCDLALLARAALESQRPAAQRAGQMLLHDLRPAPVLGDPLALELAIGCLLRQQLRRLPAGGAVVLRVQTEGERAWLELRSSADEATQARAWQEADAPAGGPAADPDLGSALAQATIERHGGTLYGVDAQAEEGLRAALPLYRQPPPCDAPATAPRRIVLVEDIDSVRQTLAATLEREGHAVHSAPDGVQGLHSVLKVWPDAAVVDLSLPGISGLELARQARRQGYAGRMVAVAGYGTPHAPAEAMRCGFDAWLTKPVSLHELRQALQPERIGAASPGPRQPADDCNQFSGSSHGLDPHRR